MLDICLVSVEVVFLCMYMRIYLYIYIHIYINTDTYICKVM